MIIEWRERGWASFNRFGFVNGPDRDAFSRNAFLFITFFAPSIEVLFVGQIFLRGNPVKRLRHDRTGLCLRESRALWLRVPYGLRQLLCCGRLGQLNRIWCPAVSSLDLSHGVGLPHSVRNPMGLAGASSRPNPVRPESPWWLVKKEQYAEAEKSSPSAGDANRRRGERGTIAQMVYTIQLEDELDAGGSYLDCFSGVDLRRTEISRMTFAGQMLSGAQLAYGPSYFFLQAGMSVDDAYKVGIGSTALAFLGTVLSWFLLTYFGRRTIYVSGISGLASVLLLIGIISVSTSSTAGLWAQASLCLIWQLIYSLSVGPICYAIISETSAIRLRANTVVLARNSYNVVTIVSAVLEAYMINPSEWN